MRLDPQADLLQAMDIEGIAMGPVRLENLVDEQALRELAGSFERLFGIPIRILSASGAVLAETAASAVSPPAEEVIAGLVSNGPTAVQGGATYRVIPIEYDRRLIGRVVVGPYLPAESAERDAAEPPPIEFAAAGPRPSAQPPRARPEVVELLSEHVRATLDLILFSGHKALLTSTMHLASVRESYRELSEKNQRLREAYERLQELDRLKSNFLATMSHELRTPLTSIIGYSEMLEEGIGGALNEEQHDFVQTIRSKGEQLLGLIMELLDLSKLESGTLLMSRTEVRIREVLAEAVSTMTPSATKKGITLRLSSPSDLPLVLGDPDRLRQVFVNLTENAIKFTDPGGKVELSAGLARERPGEEPGLILVAPVRQAVEVRVADSGIGIPESERSRVFDPFYQVDQSSTREYGGTGLGLSIVKKLVDAHHGSVVIEPNSPNGSVFVITLPVAGTPASPVSRSLPPVLR
jgi:two-component system, NarL family, sensor histidine kinase BarA